MSNYKSQQRREDISPSRKKSVQTEYSIGLLEKALGFVRVFGLTNISPGVRMVLDSALNAGDCTQEQIDSAHTRYQSEYEQNPFKKMFP